LAFEAARSALVARGLRVAAVVDRVVLYEQVIEPADLLLLQDGLAALDRHYHG
jgi:hypothetical protein